MWNPFSDAAILYAQGQALWDTGTYNSMYPYPAVVLFALMSRLPLWVVVTLVTGASLAILVALTKRSALLWMFFTPFLQVVWLGQIDMPFVWLMSRPTPTRLALLTLKPQLFVLALPVLWKDKSLIRPTLLRITALYLPFTLARTAWIAEWLGHAGYKLGEASVSLWAVPVLAMVAIGVCLKFRAWRSAAVSLNPALRAYDFVALVGSAPAWIVPMSWLAALASNALSGLPWSGTLMGLVPGGIEWPYALMGFVAWLDMRHTRNRPHLRVGEPLHEKASGWHDEVVPIGWREDAIRSHLRNGESVLSERGG